MFKKIALVLCLGVLSATLWANEAAAPAGKDDVGYVLLDKFVTGFKQMAEKGSGGYDVVNALLQESMAEAKAARAQGKIEAPFYRRYTRILLVAKLAIVDTPYDKEGILDHFIAGEINAFIEDVTGESGTVDPKGQGKRGIGSIAGAMAEEILYLHAYLDGLKNRPELLKKFGLN